MAYFKYKNKSVYYRVIGTGEPIMLLAGNTASSKMFNSILPRYTKEYKVILIDFPGHGRSERVNKFETDFWFYNSRVCFSLLEELQLDKVSLIGTSGGALVAINLCLEHPEKINYLVADSFEGEYPLNSYINSLKSEREKDKKNLLSKNFWLYNHGFDWKRIVDLDTEMLIEFAQTGNSFFHKSISDIKVPTLLTGSMEDEYCDHLDEIYGALKKKNRNLEIHIFESGNHPAMLSNKDLFFALIDDKIKHHAMK